MRAFHAMAVLLLLAVAILPAAAGAPPSRVPVNVLVFGTNTSDIVSLDPAQAFEFTGVWVNYHVYDTLDDFTRDFSRVVPRLPAPGRPRRTCARTRSPCARQPSIAARR